MPKPRATDRKHKSFEVSPWQEKSSRSMDDDESACSVRHTKLICLSPVAESSASASDPPLPSKVQSVPDSKFCSTSKWSDKVSTAGLIASPKSAPSPAETPSAIFKVVGAHLPGSFLVADPKPTPWIQRRGPALKLAAEGGERDQAPRIGAQVFSSESDGQQQLYQPLVSSVKGSQSERARTVGWDSEEDVSDKSSDLAQSLSGTCQLAILASGQLSGHVVDSQTRTCLGLAGRRLFGGPSATAGCNMSEDSEILYLTIINFQTGCEAGAMVEKTGGDLACMHPAEDWQIRRFLPDVATKGSEPDCTLQISFTAGKLVEGEVADKLLSKFNPKLVNRQAIVNVGSISISDLPKGFLRG